LFQNYVTDKVDRTLASAILVVGTAKKLLIAFQAFGCAEMELGTTIGTVDQAGKQTFPPGGSGSALVLSQLLDPQPSILVNDRLLHIWDDLMFLHRVVNGFVDFVADGGAFEVHGAAGVLSVSENASNGTIVPAIGVCRWLVGLFPPY
jgi:hypothetical protein